MEQALFFLTADFGGPFFIAAFMSLIFGGWMAMVCDGDMRYACAIIGVIGLMVSAVCAGLAGPVGFLGALAGAVAVALVLCVGAKIFAAAEPRDDERDNWRNRRG
jgi:hypothetical protein